MDEICRQIVERNMDRLISVSWDVLDHRRCLVVTVTTWLRDRDGLKLSAHVLTRREGSSINAEHAALLVPQVVDAFLASQPVEAIET